MSDTATGNPEQSRRRFAHFVRRARRRAWTILLVRYWLRAAAICVVLGAAIHVNSDVGPSVLIEVGVLVSLVAALVLSVFRRRMVEDFMFAVDQHYDAAGRIVAAAEFLRSRESPDAFRKLAIEDAAEWISMHPRRGLPRTLGKTRRPAARVAFCVAAALLLGCESPQPATPGERATKPDVAPPGLGERPKQKEVPAPTTSGNKPRPEHGDERETPGRTAAGLRPRETRAGPGVTQRAGEGAGPAPPQPENVARGSAPAPPSPAAPEPTPQPTSAGENAAEQRDQPQRPDETPESEDGPPGGQQAGTEEAEKQQDNREVDAPDDDVLAPEADDESPGVGRETEGIGEELTDGATPPPQTQPVTPEDYRDARRQDLTRERVSPARRALIEQYFQNLRNSGQRPTSQPASQSSSRPARKAEHS
jgi:hypothetical protein